MAQYVKVPVSLMGVGATRTNTTRMTFRVGNDRTTWYGTVAEQLRAQFPNAQLLVKEIADDMVFVPTDEAKAAYMRRAGITYLEDFSPGEIICMTDFVAGRKMKLVFRNRVDITPNAADMILRDCGCLTDVLLHARHFPDKQLMVIEDHGCQNDESLDSVMVLGRHDGQFFLAVLTKRTS